MTANRKWTDVDIAEVIRLRDSEHLTFDKIGKQLDRPGEQCRNTYRRYKTLGVTGSKETEEHNEYEQGNDFINIVCASKRMLSKEDIIRMYKIDLNEWDIERFRVKTSEGYRKDRRVIWQVEDGHVLKGDVDDTGKMLVVPLYHIEVRLVRKKKEIEARSVIHDMIEDAKKHAPVYQKIAYPTYSDGLLYEVDMFDIHFGRLTWEEESGESYDIKIAKKAIESTLVKLLAAVEKHPISRILLPIGNDFFNVDNKFNTTTGGTPQQEDTRWQKTFRAGRNICIWMIDTCAQIAPVDVLIVPGNHDEQRSFYLGESLDCWYNKNADVNIDNSAAKHKYYLFGANLIGFTHGYDEKLKDLPLLMAIDKPDLWAQSTYREWHTGDKHNKKDLTPNTDEGTGIVVRILRALAAQDAWTYNKGYRSLRSGEAFLWHPSNGLIAQFTATPDVSE